MTEPSELPLLPKGWTWTKLADILGFVKGKKPVNVGPKTGLLTIPYIDIEAFEKCIINRFTDGKNCSLCNREDVLIVWDGARCGLVGKGASGAIGSTLAKLVCYHINPNYLFYFLQSKFNYINKRPRGVGIPHVDPNIFWNIPFPIAPQKEQNRIVGKVEELFSFLDAGVASLHAVQAQLRRYRQAVLKHAFEGKLTEQWRESHQGLENIVKQQLKQILTQKQENRSTLKPDFSKLCELPPGWLWVTIDQITTVVRGASPRPAGHPRFFGGSIPWITVGPLTADEQPYLRSVLQTVTEEGCKASRYISANTLLLTNSGATLGVPKITLIDGCINDGVVALLEVDNPLKLYLYYYLKSQTRRLRGLNQGAAQPNLNTGIIKSISVPFPSLGEQEKIINLIKKVFERIDYNTEVVKSEILRSQQLKASILNRAFTGKLLPQNPNDEPAQRLLERIKEDRLGSKSKNKNQVELSEYVK